MPLNLNLDLSFKDHLTDEEIGLLNPISRFQEWLNLELSHNIFATTMSLATVSNGKPRVRVVTLGKVTEEGFCFDTYIPSGKNKELEKNPVVSFTVMWLTTQRTARVEGKAVTIPAVHDSPYYSWHSVMKLDAQSSANKSGIITATEYAELQKGHAVFREKFAGMENDIPKPEFIKSFRIVPESIEFLEMFPNGLDERIRFDKNSNSKWKFVRLCP